MSGISIADSSTLIAEYTLGLLNEQEASQVQSLLGSNSQAAITALNWENRFLELVDLLPPTEPRPKLLQELQSALGHAITPAPARQATTLASTPVVRPAPVITPTPPTQARISPEHETLTVAAALRTPEKPVEAPISQTTAPAPRPLPARNKTSAQQSAKAGKAPPERTTSGNIWLWRMASAVFALIAVIVALMPRQPKEPPVTVVEVAPTQAAIMQAPGQSSTPGWVVTVDPQGNVLMHPKVRTDIPSDASVQLWTYSQPTPQPRSLGLINPNQSVTVPASLLGEISQDQIFEMTQEPVGGSATASPSGPILFIGRLVTFGKPAMAPPPNDPSSSGEQ